MTLALDGTASGSAFSGNPVSSGLTTTKANDILIALVSTYGTTGAPSPSGVTDNTVGGSLTWTRRFTSGAQHLTISGVYVNLDIWYTIAPAATSGIDVTATMNSGSYTKASIQVFAVSGVNTVTPFDTNGSLPATNSSVNGSTATVSGVSTTASNTFIFAMSMQASVLGAGTGFTEIIGGNGQDNEYQIVSSPQSSITVNFSGTTNGGYYIVADALQGAATSAPETLPMQSLSEHPVVLRANEFQPGQVNLLAGLLTQPALSFNFVPEDFYRHPPRDHQTPEFLFPNLALPYQPADDEFILLFSQMVLDARRPPLLPPDSGALLVNLLPGLLSTLPTVTVLMPQICL